MLCSVRKAIFLLILCLELYFKSIINNINQLKQFLSLFLEF